MAVDVVSFGDIEENAQKLEAFIASVNKNNNSTLVTVPHGAVLADVLLSTSIFVGDDSVGAGGSGFAAAAAAASSAAAHGNLEGTDIDMMGTDDPALLLALRVSLEEERARQEAQAQASLTEGTERDPANGCASEPPTVLTSGTTLDDTNSLSLDEDALLQRAFALSMSEAGRDDMESSLSAMETNITPTSPKSTEEDHALALAKQMSMADQSTHMDETAMAACTEGEANMGEMLSDSSYVNAILASLPGVDTNDPAIQQTLNNLDGASDKHKETEEEK